MYANEVLMRSNFLPHIRIDRGYPNCHLGQKALFLAKVHTPYPCSLD